MVAQLTDGGLVNQGSYDDIEIKGAVRRKIADGSCIQAACAAFVVRDELASVHLGCPSHAPRWERVADRLHRMHIKPLMALNCRNQMMNLWKVLDFKQMRDEN